MSDCFAGCRIWLDGELPRAYALQLVDLIRNNDGRVLSDPTKATHFVLHPETEHFEGTYAKASKYKQAHCVLAHWVTDCDIFGKSIPENEPQYRIPAQRPTPVVQDEIASAPSPKKKQKRKRKVTEEADASPGKKTRNRYTEEEDEAMARAVAKYAGRVSKHEISRRLARKHPTHPASSWLERWCKVKEEWVEERVKELLDDEPDLGEEAFSSEPSEDEGEVPEKRSARKGKRPSNGSNGKASPDKRKKPRKKAEVSSEDEQSEDEYVDYEAMDMRKDDEDEDDLTESQAVRRVQEEERDDLHWATNGDEELAKEFMEADREKQRRLIKTPHLFWLPKEDAEIFAAKKDATLKQIATKTERKIAEIRARQAYLVREAPGSRAAPGTLRWPFDEYEDE